MTQTQTSVPPGLDPNIAALIPSGNDIYDAIMGKIEPELVSDQLSQLQQKYGGESEQARAERMERYKQAFSAYDAAYKRWLNNVRQAVRAKRLDALEKAEMELQKNDATELQNLESHFSS